MKNKNLLLIIGVILLLSMLVYCGFKFWQNRQLDNTYASLNSELITVVNQLDQLDGNNVLGIIAAKKTLDEIDQNSVKWSKVIKTISQTIPQDAKGNMIVDILSYSGSSADEISLNVSTIGGDKDPYASVAKFIAGFNDSEYFEGNFVPSIASGLSTDGKEILTFTFSTKFVEEDFVVLQATPVLR